MIELNIYLIEILIIFASGIILGTIIGMIIGAKLNKNKPDPDRTGRSKWKYH